MLEEAQRHSQSYLSRVREGLRSIGIAASVATLPGAPARAITDWAGREPDALVVMSTHGRGGINRLVLGSVTDRVVRHANTPVLVVRKWDEPGFTGVEERVSQGYSAGFGNAEAQPA